MNRHYWLQLFFSLTSLGLIMLPLGCGAAGQPPTKVMVINSREEMGCLVRQQIKQDLTVKPGGKNRINATIEEIKNAEDLTSYNQFYLVFPARAATGLNGSLVVILWSYQEAPDLKAYLTLETAELKGAPQEWSIDLKLKGTGILRAQLLYSQNPGIQQTWAACPEAGINEPYQLAFFSAYPLEGGFSGGEQSKLSGKWQSVRLTFNPLFTEEAAKIDRCQALLEKLNSKLAAAESAPLVWDEKKLTQTVIKSLVDQAATETQSQLQLLLKLSDGRTIQLGTANFLPQLRQRMAVKTSQGKLVGAELWLRTD